MKRRQYAGKNIIRDEVREQMRTKLRLPYQHDYMEDPLYDALCFQLKKLLGQQMRGLK